MSLAASTKPSRLRLDFIEGMRATAALVVVVNHGYAQAWCAFYGQFPPPALSFLTYSLVVGHLAVSVFIVISGFCLTLPVARGDGTLRGGATEFFRRRARRILPPYYAALALSLLLIETVIGKPSGSLWDVAIQIRASDLVSHVLLLQHFFGTGRINYAFWSISLEWQLYFLFPLLVLLFRRWSGAGTVLVALALGYAATLFLGGRIARANLHYLGLFTVGMLAAHLACSRQERLRRLAGRIPWRGVAALALTASVTLMLRWGWKEAIEHWPLLDLLVGVAAAGLLISSAVEPDGWIATAFSWRPLVWIGRFSYSLYLVHAPLLQLLWLYGLKPLGLGREAEFIALMAGGVPIILGASYLFFRVFEAPFIGAPARVPVPAAVVESG